MKIDEREDIREDHDDSFSIEEYDKSVGFQKEEYDKDKNIANLSNLIEQLEFTKDDISVDVVSSIRNIKSQKASIEIAKMREGGIIEGDNSSTLISEHIPKKKNTHKMYSKTNTIKPHLSSSGHRYIRGYIADINNIYMLDVYKNEGISTFTTKQRGTFNRSNIAIVKSVLVDKKNDKGEVVQGEKGVLNKIQGYVNIEQFLQKVNAMYGTDFSIQDKLDDNFGNEPPYRALKDTHPNRGIYRDEELEEFLSVRNLSRKIASIEYICKKFHGFDIPYQYKAMADGIEKLTAYTMTLNEYKRNKSSRSRAKSLANKGKKLYMSNGEGVDKIQIFKNMNKKLEKDVVNIISGDINIHKYKNKRRNIMNSIKRGIEIDTFRSKKDFL